MYFTTALSSSTRKTYERTGWAPGPLVNQEAGWEVSSTCGGPSTAGYRGGLFATRGRGVVIVASGGVKGRGCVRG